MADCRDTLALNKELKEIIFATTAPDDGAADNAAMNVEKTLAAEGYKVSVSVYGWRALQLLIAKHPVAYQVFCPSAAGTTTPDATAPLALPDDFAAKVAEQVATRMAQVGIAIQPKDSLSEDKSSEDPALHARIDTYRDLFKLKKQPKVAEEGLRELLAKEDLSQKPWARYRVEANLGSITLTLGREDEAIKHFETAYELRPDDANAVANMALARTIQGRYEEGMQLARTALSSSPRADYAVAYLVQAAARSDWQGDPESLIPDDLKGTESADIGIAEFIRRREQPGWAQRTIELSRRHPDSEDFKRISALAVLEIQLSTNRFYITRNPLLTEGELKEAADNMLRIAEYQLSIGLSDQHDLFAQLNNTALLLRLTGRYEECEILLKRAMGVMQLPPALSRLLGLCQVALHRKKEALDSLAMAPDDLESQLVSIELTVPDDPKGALERVRNLKDNGEDNRLTKIRWRLVGELALQLDQFDAAKEAIEKLRFVDQNDVFAKIIEQGVRASEGVSAEDIAASFREIVKNLPSDIDVFTRFILGEELRNRGLFDEVISILAPTVDLHSNDPQTHLYIQSLASKGHDAAFRKALNDASDDVRNSPAILWAIVVYEWNISNLPGALEAVDRLLVVSPEHLPARLRKIEILLRQNKTANLLAELDKPIEDLPWKKLSERFRVASLLGHFGFSERATKFSYRLYLEHRDNSQAWMALIAQVLGEGRHVKEGRPLWTVEDVGNNAAVDLQFENGAKAFFVIEPDPELRRLDTESWEPNHPLVQKVWSLKKGDRFTTDDGREGTITQLRHKYVARMHFIMEHYEVRFPSVFGIKRIAFNPKQPGGMDQFLEELKARREWVEAEQDRYLNGPWMLGMFADRVGTDVIEAAEGLAAQGLRIKVTPGSESHRQIAVRNIAENKKRGCVLDLLTFWTAWKLSALETVSEVCGPIHLPQSVIDSLIERRSRITSYAASGFKSATYEGGRVAIQEVDASGVQRWLNDTDQALAWAQAKAVIKPRIVTDDLPEELKEQFRSIDFDLLDAVLLAKQLDFLFLSDDLGSRELGESVGLTRSAWLHLVMLVAAEFGRVEFDTYVRWSANLLEAKRWYLGVSWLVLARALELDMAASNKIDRLYTAVISTIGGQHAEPGSHIEVCTHFLEHIWSHSKFSGVREPATGMLLRRLITDRRDRGVILRTFVRLWNPDGSLFRYVMRWIQGHFLIKDLEEPAPPQLPPLLRPALAPVVGHGIGRQKHKHSKKHRKKKRKR